MKYQLEQNQVRKFLKVGHLVQMEKHTTDASVALKGTMAPAGGYKGFGMGLFVEIMSACLTGSNLGIEASSFANDQGGSSRNGTIFYCYKP